MKITPITKIKNVFLRRTLTLTVMPVLGLLGMLVLIPLGALVDMVLAVIKFTYKSFLAIFVDFPISTIKVEVEMWKMLKVGIAQGWAGPAPIMPPLKDETDGTKT